MKTKEQWDEANVDLDVFLQKMDEVDERLYMYMASVVAPQFCNQYFLQVGEADFELYDVYYYTTFMKANDKYYYLGSMPEFKQ